MLSNRLALIAIVAASAALAPAGSSPRLRIRFDDGWKFKRDTNTRLLGTPIRDWTLLPAPNATIETATAPDELTEPGRTIKIGDPAFGGRPGFAFFRTELPASFAGPNRILHFEAVDDNCVVFLNGKRLTVHRGWNEPFEVRIDSAWAESGPNLLYVLVENQGGEGGIHGAVTLMRQTPAFVPAQVNPAFNDRAWREVHLPHDYVVEEKFDRNADTGHGSLPVIPAWYRKTFNVPATYRSKKVWIDFDGIYRNADIYLNGKPLGKIASGYIGSRFDIGPALKYGSPNVLAVRVDPRQAEGWWYEGGGIYRHVWLNVSDPVHVEPWGVFVNASPAKKGAKVAVQTAVVNSLGKPQKVEIASTILDPNGNAILTQITSRSVKPNGRLQIDQALGLPSAQLWSIETPVMYRLRTSVRRGGEEIDRVETPFGIRSMRWDADKGFFLNGKPVKLKGTCNHQDFIGVGTGIPDGILEWRIRKLKSMGSNAYRCSHNPPAAELLDACDRLGMVVMDETRHLGDTTLSKTPAGTPAKELTELKAMLLRDRNHPSVIMWSMCNEEPLQGSADGARIYSAMKAVARKLDPTRPVTSAMNGGWGQGISLVQDLQGANYNPGGYDDFHRRFPKMPFYGSETASTVSTRGIYANDTVRGYVSAYDLNFPGWANTAEDAWRPIGERPFMAGGFVWTGFDYKGEPTPYGWPCINSHFGILDMCGFPKDNFYYYKAWWGTEPVVHLLPHWNRAGKEGQPIDVWAHSNADEVELWLNGRSLGRKKMVKFSHLQWTVPYAPGELIARGYRHGKVIATDRVSTAGAPAALRLRTDRPSILADREDISPIEVEVVDAKGRVVPTADAQIKFSVTGPGGIAGVGNGDPSSHEPDQANTRRAFNGLAMALVRSKDRAGRIVLRATSPGLRSAEITVTAK